MSGHRLGLTGLAALLALTVVWGLNWPAMKLGVVEFPPLFFRVLCAVPAAAGLALLARAAGQSLAITRAQILPLAIAGLCNVTAWMLFSAFALQLIDAGRASILGFTMPFWTVLLSRWLLDERLGRRQLAGLLGGAVGLVLLFLPAIDQIGSSAGGMALMIGAALAWAYGSVFVKGRRWGLNVSAVAFWQMAMGSIPICIAAAVLESGQIHLGAVSQTAWWATAYAALIATVFGYWLYFRLLSLVPASVAGMSVLMIPAVGVISSALLLGESYSVADLTAVACLLSGLAAVVIPGRTK